MERVLIQAANLLADICSDWVDCCDCPFSYQDIETEELKCAANEPWKLRQLTD